MRICTEVAILTHKYVYVCMYTLIAGFGAVMAAEREQKLRNLRSQHTHNDHTIKKVDHVTTTINVTHSPKFPKKQSATGKQTPEDVGAIVKENQKAMPHKRVKQKVYYLSLLHVYLAAVLRVYNTYVYI